MIPDGMIPLGNNRYIDPYRYHDALTKFCESNQLSSLIGEYDHPCDHEQNDEQPIGMFLYEKSGTTIGQIYKYWLSGLSRSIDSMFFDPFVTGQPLMITSLPDFMTRKSNYTLRLFADCIDDESTLKEIVSNTKLDFRRGRYDNECDLYTYADGGRSSIRYYRTPPTECGIKTNRKGKKGRF